MCCPCLQSDPFSQHAWSPAPCGGGEASLQDEGPEGLCVDFESLLGFLSAAEWASVQQAARYLCPGFKVSSPVGAGVEIGVLKELLGSTFVEGLQEIEGWLDFAQVAEDLDTLEHDVWNGGTLSTQAARLKVFSSLRWRLADFLEQAARVKVFWLDAGCGADARAQDFVQRASVLSSAQPHLCAWRVCEPLEADIFAFVHRVALVWQWRFLSRGGGKLCFPGKGREGMHEAGPGVSGHPRVAGGGEPCFGLVSCRGSRSSGCWLAAGSCGGPCSAGGQPCRGRLCWAVAQC